MKNNPTMAAALALIAGVSARPDESAAAVRIRMAQRKAAGRVEDARSALEAGRLLADGKSVETAEDARADAQAWREVEHAADAYQLALIETTGPLLHANELRSELRMIEVRLSDLEEEKKVLLWRDIRELSATHPCALEERDRLVKALELTSLDAPEIRRALHPQHGQLNDGGWPEEAIQELAAELFSQHVTRRHQEFSHLRTPADAKKHLADLAIRIAEGDERLQGGGLDWSEIDRLSTIDPEIAEVAAQLEACRRDLAEAEKEEAAATAAREVAKAIAEADAAAAVQLHEIEREARALAKLGVAIA